jgi:hypothetical protein
MIDGELPNKLTPVTPEEAAKFMADAFKTVTGAKPSTKVLKLLLGQWALETGNGKYIHNYNFGNVKRRKADTHWQFFRCSEIINGQEVFFDPPHPACSFAAYLDGTSGAVAFIETLKRRPHWWDGLMTGTADGFVKGLTTSPAYFTANPERYKTVLVERSDKFAALAKKYGGSAVGLIAAEVTLFGLIGWWLKGRRNRV